MPGIKKPVNKLRTCIQQKRNSYNPQSVDVCTPNAFISMVRRMQVAFIREYSPVIQRAALYMRKLITTLLSTILFIFSNKI